MRIDTISLIVSAFVSAFLGIAVLIRNFRNPLYFSFSCFCALLLGRDFLCLMKGFEHPLFFSPLLFLFITLLLGPASCWWLLELRPLYKKKSRSLFLPYGLLLGGIALAALFPDYHRYSSLLQALAEATFLIPAYLWAIALANASQSEELPREKVRYRYALWGLVLVIGFHLTDTLYFTEQSSVVPLGTLARSLYLIFLFQLFIQRELITFQELLSRVFLFGVISLVLSSIYWLLVSWVDTRPGLFLFNTFIASFAILVLFDPLRSAVSRLMNKLFLKRNLQLEQELNALADDLRGIADPSELSSRIRSSLKRVLGIEKATLYLLEKDGVSYVRPEEFSSDSVSEVAASNPLLEYMTLRRGRPFVAESLRTDLESFHSPQGKKFVEDCLESLRQLGADLVIPFFYDSKVIGFVTAPLSEKIILSNDLLRLFVPVSRQIALLLKSAQTLTVLRDRDKLATIGEMAAGLAHEIKNPLGAIKGAAELLAEEKNEKVASEYLKIIQDEAERLSGVLSQFLDYARPRKNDPESSCWPLRVIEHTAALSLRDAKITFIVQSDSDDIRAEVDPEILKQVLLNLFLNAVQAMEGVADAVLKVTVREIKPRKRWALGIPLYKSFEGWSNPQEQTWKPFVEIQVQDNGPGIPANELAKVFVPFFTTKSKGTGLGLPICQRLMESVGGSIQVKPNLPRGTRFILHLPGRVPAKKVAPLGILTEVPS
jgi:signal transduction histidine kinase